MITFGIFSPSTRSFGANDLSLGKPKASAAFMKLVTFLVYASFVNGFSILVTLPGFKAFIARHNKTPSLKTKSNLRGGIQSSNKASIHRQISASMYSLRSPTC